MAAHRRPAAGQGVAPTAGAPAGGARALLYPLALGLAVAVPLALHGSVLRWPFLSDDYIFLSYARGWDGLLRGLAESPNYLRPLGRDLYFFAGYQMAGPNPFAFHLVNFAILAVTLVLVATLARRLAGPRAGVVAAMVYALLYPHRVLMGWVSCAQDLIATALAVLAALAWLGGRRWLAAGAFLAGLLAKESIAPLPLVLALGEAWSRADGRGGVARLAPAMRRTAPLWAAAAIWALVLLVARGGRAAAAPGASLTMADISLAPAALWEGLRSALLVCLYLDQPWGRLAEALRGLDVPWLAIGLAVAAVVGAHGLARPAPRPARAGDPAPARLGVVWLLAGALPVALAGHHFSAYYVSFMAVGFALAAGTWLARGPLAVALVAVAAGATLAVAANQVTVFRATRAAEVAPGVSWVTARRLDQERVFLDSLQAALRRDPPPAGAVVFLIDLPPAAAFATAGFRAASVWFDDPSLEMTTIGRYRPEAETREPRFLRYEPGRRGFVALPRALVDAMRDGDAAMARDDPRGASRVFEQALAMARRAHLDFERIEIENKLGLTSAWLGDTTRARLTWHAILAGVPHHRGALLNLAMLEGDVGRFEEARHLVRRVLVRHPQDRMGLRLLVRLDQVLGDSVAARRDWERLAAAHPAFAESLARAGGP